MVKCLSPNVALSRYSILLTRHSLPKITSKDLGYPVDDFWLKRADDAGVVEDWMLFIQFFKGCSCLGTEIQLLVSLLCVCVCVCSCATTW